MYLTDICGSVLSSGWKKRTSLVQKTVSLLSFFFFFFFFFFFRSSARVLIMQVVGTPFRMYNSEKTVILHCNRCNGTRVSHKKCTELLVSIVTKFFKNSSNSLMKRLNESKARAI